MLELSTLSLPPKEGVEMKKIDKANLALPLP
jgi:hypothetical protein